MSQTEAKLCLLSPISACVGVGGASSAAPFTGVVFSQEIQDDS